MGSVNKHLAEKLRELRGNAPLNKVEKQTGVSRANLARYEQGQYLPSQAVLQKLADYYQVAYKDLRKLYYEDHFTDPLERDIVLEWANEASKK